MTPAIRYRWQGKPDPDDSSGEATYTINGKQHGDRLHLPHFSHAEHIYQMIQDAYALGRSVGRQEIKQAVEFALWQNRGENHVDRTR